jgi:hypothetical protein
MPMKPGMKYGLMGAGAGLLLPSLLGGGGGGGGQAPQNPISAISSLISMLPILLLGGGALAVIQMFKK